MRLDGHKALVTGGSQGVGAAIAQRLALAGCDLLLQGLEDGEEFEQTVTRCRSHGVRVDTMAVDLAAPPNDWTDRIEQAAFGGDRAISILVNNAGTCRDRPFLEMDWQTYQHTQNLNVAAGYFLTQACARRWIADGISGRVLFTGSINGVLAEAGHTAYDTSKGAVHSLVRSLCVALAPHGIRVNAIAPGLVHTPLTQPVLSQEAELAWMQLHTPNGTVPPADACAGTALFLVSDEAEHVQGQTVFVDGGMSVWQQPELPEKLRGRFARFND